MKEKKRKNNRLLTVEIILLGFSILLIWTIQNNILITIALVILTFLCFFLEYHKGEWTLFIMGILLGIISELGGNLVFKLQYWNVESILGIPLWLPVLWGYAFVFIRRIGNIIVKN